MSSTGLPWSVATTSTSTRFVSARKTVDDAAGVELWAACWPLIADAEKSTQARARAAISWTDCIGQCSLVEEQILDIDLRSDIAPGFHSCDSETVNFRWASPRCDR